MLLEVQYLTVFRPGSDPKAVIAAALKQAYEDELGDVRDSALIEANIAIQLRHVRDDGQIVAAFRISDDREESEWEAVCAAFGKSLAADTSADHILKFHDSTQSRRYQKFAEEIYRLEMRLREAISFIFIDTYGDDYYNLLRDVNTAIAMKEPPTPDHFKSHHENQFFFLLFDQYVRVNERKLPNPQGLLELIGRSADFSALQGSLSGKPIEKPLYSDFLAKIKDWMHSIEKLRNCVAHNRAFSKNTVPDYENARKLLHAAIDEFFRAVQAPPLS